MDTEEVGLVVGGFCIGIVLLGSFFCICDMKNISISQETADDICKQLTGNQTVVAEDTIDRTLICRLPSFDSTQNIIFKLNSEE